MSKSINLVIRDNFGNLVEFTSSEQVRDFLAAERENWSWLQQAPHRLVDMDAQYLANLRNMDQWVAMVEDGRYDDQQFVGNMVSMYGSSRPTLLFSDQWPGAAVNSMRQKFGADLAERALAILTGKRDFQPADLDDFRAMQLIYCSSFIEPEAWQEEQQRRIASARRAMTSEVAKYRDMAVTLVQDTKKAVNRDRASYRRIAKRLIGRSKMNGLYFVDQANEKLAQMDATRAAYAEQMRLEAPVTYWEDKARMHRNAADNWMAGLIAFVATAAFVLYQTLHAAWEALPATGALSGRHLFVVAGVGALLTTAFWFARLGVRIYLGERHLITDAEERRVMTKAYLALIKDKAASNEERLVILSALFRSAQDGIVRDDGAGDVSLPAMVAKLLDAKTGTPR